MHKTQTRCKYVHVRSTAALTAMDGGNAGNAGAVTGHAAEGPLIYSHSQFSYVSEKYA